MDDNKTYIPFSEAKTKINLEPLDAKDIQDYFDSLKVGQQIKANIWLKYNVLAGLLYSYKSLLTYNSFLKLIEAEHKTVARILLYYTAFFGVKSLTYFQGRHMKYTCISNYQNNDDTFIYRIKKTSITGSHQLVWTQFKKLYFNNPTAASEFDLTVQHIFQMEYDFTKVRNKINYQISDGFDELEGSLDSLRDNIWLLPSYDSILDIGGNSKKSPFLIDFDSDKLIEIWNSEEAYTRLFLTASLKASLFFVNDNEYLKKDFYKNISFIKQGKYHDLFPEF